MFMSPLTSHTDAGNCFWETTNFLSNTFSSNILFNCLFYFNFSTKNPCFDLRPLKKCLNVPSIVKIISMLLFSVLLLGQIFEIPWSIQLSRLYEVENRFLMTLTLPTYLPGNLPDPLGENLQTLIVSWVWVVIFTFMFRFVYSTLATELFGYR